MEKYLTDVEKKIFYRLKENEQKHSVRVAMLIIEIYDKKNEYKDIDLDRIIKAAILHDIGKSEKRINVIQKTIMVLLGWRLKEYTNIEFIDAYYNHAELGYNILKNYVDDEKLLFLIRNHHKNSSDDIELKLLKYCDDKN